MLPASIFLLLLHNIHVLSPIPLKGLFILMQEISRKQMHFLFPLQNSNVSPLEIFCLKK